MVRQRRRQLEAMLASAEAGVERARPRSRVVDVVVGVVRRERPVGCSGAASRRSPWPSPSTSRRGGAARLAVAAEELNAALWERRHPGDRPDRRAGSSPGSPRPPDGDCPGITREG
jgi:hypothetical protein